MGFDGTVRFKTYTPKTKRTIKRIQNCQVKNEPSKASKIRPKKGPMQTHLANPPVFGSAYVLYNVRTVQCTPKGEEKKGGLFG